MFEGPCACEDLGIGAVKGRMVGSARSKQKEQVINYCLPFFTLISYLSGLRFRVHSVVEMLPSYHF